MRDAGAPVAASVLLRDPDLSRSEEILGNHSPVAGIHVQWA
jgi:hypothetical protein